LNALSARPVVSVIISAYNVADYIGAAIESALAQTYPNVEVIVVDDGSTDGTGDAIDRYRSQIVVVSQENAGVCAARNAGIRAATGNLLAVLDGDDLWLPERLERLVALLEARPDLGMVTSDSWVMEGFEPTERRSYRDRRKRPFPAVESEQIPEIARFNFLFVGVVFRRELIDECGMFGIGPRRGLQGSIESAEDYELWTRFLLTGSRAGFVDEPLGYYRVRPGSLSQSPQQALAHQAVLEMHLPALWNQGAKGYARDAYEIGTRLVVRGERRAALPFFLHALTGEGARGSRLQYAASSLRRLVWPSDLHRKAHGSARAVEPAVGSDS
jgi:Glycosyltransferases involved in cell wall biogenesis